LPRDSELTTAEALDLVRQLAEVGFQEVSLIGGEAYLRKDWERIATAITDAGMIPTLVTGGWGLGRGLARRIAAAGIGLVSVSIDGLETSHDLLRRREGSWRQAFAALDHLKSEQVTIASNTQLNRLSIQDLPLLYERLRGAAIAAWQIQLTGPLGNAADDSALILHPAELDAVFTVLARIARRARSDGIWLRPNDNVGYYGPYERLLRSGGHEWGFWQGAHDGISTIGIESDGSIKADPTLPSADYVGGNIRVQRLADIIERASNLQFAMNADDPSAVDELWGFCRSCCFGQLCRGGAPWMAHTLLGRRGNNPFCHHRALELARRGRRERLRMVRPAPGIPFDHATWEVLEEPLDAPWPTDARSRFTEDQVVWPDTWVDPRSSPIQLPAHELSRHESRTERLMPRSAYSSNIALLRRLLAAKVTLDSAEATVAYEGAPSATVAGDGRPLEGRP